MRFAGEAVAHILDLDFRNSCQFDPSLAFYPLKLSRTSCEFLYKELVDPWRLVRELKAPKMSNLSLNQQVMSAQSSYNFQTHPDRVKLSHIYRNCVQIACSLVPYSGPCRRFSRNASWVRLKDESDGRLPQFSHFPLRKQNNVSSRAKFLPVSLNEVFL